MSSSRRPLAALSLSVLLSALGTSIANVALPSISKSFAAPIQRVQWVVVAYLLAITLTIVIVGRLADLYGRRRLLLAGMSVFGVASAVCGVAPGLTTLIAARAAQGLGAAAMMALAMPFVADTVSKERAGRAMGLLGTTSAIGTALGPSLGGLLIAASGWRSVFVVLVPLALAAAVLAGRVLPADRIERKTSAALLPLDVFTDGARTASFAMNSLVTSVVMASLVVGPFYLSGALGLDPARVGLVLSAGPLVAALGGLPAGALVDRLGTSRITIAGLLMMAGGCAALSVMPVRYGAIGWIVPIIVITSGYALFQAANNTAVMANVRADQRGVISGVLSLSRNVGLVTGASLMSAIFAVAGGAERGMHVTFGAAAGVVILALALARVASAGHWSAMSPWPPAQRAQSPAASTSSARSGR